MQNEASPTLGSQIFEGLLRSDDTVDTLSPSQRQLWRELCKQVPQVLGEELLHRSVISTVFLRARLAILDHLIESEWCERFYRDDPAAVEGQMITKAQGVLNDQRRRWAEEDHTSRHVLLSQAEAYEKQFFQTLNLNPSTETRRQQGRMPLRELLLLDPGALLRLG